MILNIHQFPQQLSITYLPLSCFFLEARLKYIYEKFKKKKKNDCPIERIVVTNKKKNRILQFFFWLCYN